MISVSDNYSQLAAWTGDVLVETTSLAAGGPYRIRPEDQAPGSVDMAGAGRGGRAHRPGARAHLIRRYWMCQRVTFLPPLGVLYAGAYQGRNKP